MANVFRLPDIGEGLTEAEIVEWFADEGDEVVADQPLVAVETDKTQTELPAPVSGILLHRGGEPGTVLEVGSVLAVVGQPGETWEGDDQPTGEGAGRPRGGTGRAAESPERAPGARPPALPLVRRRAADAGIDLTSVAGTGPGGRITRADLDDHLAATSERPPLVGTLHEDAEDLRAPRRRAEDTGRRLSATRRAIAERLTRSWREIPHVTTFDRVDATGLLAARRSMADTLGRPVALEALIVKALVPVLASHPEFNATLEGDTLTLHGTYDIGIAIDGGDGLLVGVVRSVDRRSVAGVADDIAALVESARRRALTRDQTTGATFTVSNIGAVGGGYGTPIIPWGTTAILSVGRAEDDVVVRDGGIHVAPMAPLSLSYDHRVVDGALGRAFMAAVVDALADPPTGDA